MSRLPCRALAVLIALVSVAGCDRGDHPQQISKTAPDFTVSDGTRSVHLAAYRGKVVLLNFWATWCAPCIEELPSLQALQARMPQVVVLAISVDDDPDAYRRFLADHPLNLTTVEDADRRANALYGTFRFPETFVIDRAGVIRRRFISAQEWTSPEIVNYLQHL